MQSAPKEEFKGAQEILDSARFSKNLRDSARFCVILRDSARFCKILRESARSCIHRPSVGRSRKGGEK